MTKRNSEFFYAIPRDLLDRMGVAPTLDMLRYDGSTVECNAPVGFYLFRMEGHGPHLERWASFGITDIIQGNDRVEVDMAVEKAKKAGR